MMNMNTNCDIRMRRYRNNLANSGSGFILFGFWSVIKIFMELTMKDETYEALTEEIDSARFGEAFVRTFIYVFVLVIALFVLSIHLEIGMSAIRYSRGNKKRSFFIVPTACIMLLEVMSIWGDLTPKEQDVSLELTIATVLVDMTMVFILFDMIYSVIRIKMITKEMKDEQR